MKKKLINTWIYNFGIINNITQIPSKVIGFVYLIYFTDGTKYIGKKNLYSIKKVKHSDKHKYPVIKKVVVKSKLTGEKSFYDMIKKESDWLTYQGSAKECKQKEVETKHILQFAYSPLELTYLEMKYQCKYNVLEDTKFINNNILGRFYCNKLYNNTHTF